MTSPGNPFAELTRLRAINAELLAALEMVRPTILTRGGSAEWEALCAAINKARQ